MQNPANRDHGISSNNYFCVVATDYVLNCKPTARVRSTARSSTRKLIPFARFYTSRILAKIIILSLLVVAVIHLIPITTALGGERLTALYGLHSSEQSSTARQVSKLVSFSRDRVTTRLRRISP